MADYGKLKEIDETIKRLYPNNAVLDGIVDDEIYANTTPKILWVLKESNITTPETTYKNGWFGLNDYLREDITEYSDWQRTWGLVLEISDAILHNAQEWENDVPLIDRLLKEEIIKKIAVINIKKTGGGSNSDQLELDNFYEKDKKIILAQIEAIAPDIIINASRVISLFDDLKTTVKQKGPYNFLVAKCKCGIIIDAYHPNNRILTHKRYFEIVRDCIKAVTKI
jgi:hypothetical protein